jgi:uncharacterized protein YdhG (YjbR/CyaY superfamily)
MKMQSKAVDAYIAGVPHDVQILLNRIRETIREVAPQAFEVMTYGIPTYRYVGNLVHFAAY